MIVDHRKRLSSNQLLVIRKMHWAPAGPQRWFLLTNDKSGHVGVSTYYSEFRVNWNTAFSLVDRGLAAFDLMQRRVKLTPFGHQIGAMSD